MLLKSPKPLELSLRQSRGRSEGESPWLTLLLSLCLASVLMPGESILVAHEVDEVTLTARPTITDHDVFPPSIYTYGQVQGSCVSELGIREYPLRIVYTYYLCGRHSR